MPNELIIGHLCGLNDMKAIYQVQNSLKWN